MSKKMNRRKFLKLGLAGIGICAAGGLTSLLFPRKITFEEVIKDKNLTKSYLEQLLEQNKNYDAYWQTIGRLVYEPNPKIKKTSYGFKGGIGIAYTEGTTVYLTEYAFGKEDYVLSEEELKSVIDNESVHCAFARGMRNPNYLKQHSIDEFRSLPKGLRFLIEEAISSERQIYAIFKNKRKVRPKFKKEALVVYHSLFSGLQKIAEREPEHREIILDMLSTFRLRQKK